MTTGAFRLRVACLLWRGGLCIALPVAAACRAGQRPTTVSPEKQAHWQRESAQFVQDSLKWVRDSIVRDSVSRAVDTDSLYRLYRRMLVARDPVPVMLLVDCERGRLTWQYGLEPGLAAMTRMEDTLWRKDERAEATRMWNRLANMSVDQMVTLGVSPRKCGWPLPRTTSVYDGTDLDAITSRPRPPKRP